MRAIGKALVVYLVMTSVVSVPLGLAIFIQGAGGALADAEYSLNLRFGLMGLAIGLAPAVALILLLRLLRGRWLP